MIRNDFFILVVVLSAVLVNGCLDQDIAKEYRPAGPDILSNITSSFRELPEVQYFLIMHPDANITPAYFSGDGPSTAQGADFPGALYIASIKENNSSIIALYGEVGDLLGMTFQNPQLKEDISNRLLSDANLSFNVVKLNSSIYVTFTGGLGADEVDYFGIYGQNALGRQFEVQMLGSEDGSKDNILYRTVKLEGACSTCWLNFVEVTAIYTDGNRSTVLQAQI